MALESERSGSSAFFVECCEMLGVGGVRRDAKPHEWEGRRGVESGGSELGWVVGEVIGGRCVEVRWDGGVLQARCQTSRRGRRGARWTYR